MSSARVKGLLFPKIAIGFFFVLLCQGAFASEIKSGFDWKNVQWGDVQLGVGMGIQGGGSSVSGLVRYVPEYRFEPEKKENTIGAGLDLGATGFNNQGGSNFFVLEYAAFGAYHLDVHWDFRLFAGGQSWTGGQGAAFFLGPKALYHFAEEPGPYYLDAVFVSYDAVFFRTLAHLINAGVTFKF